MPELNTELTCSLLERLFVSYLDTVIRVAVRVSHLAPEQMPPLVDRDYSAILEKSFTVGCNSPLIGIRADARKAFGPISKPEKATHLLWIGASIQ